MIAVTGYRSTIVQELSQLTDEPIRRIADSGVPDADRFVLAAGLLVGKRITEQSPEETRATFSVNVVEPLRLCEQILEGRPAATICVIGSESAILGSYDMAYAASKAALHEYVKTRKTAPGQRLVCVSPPIISDSGMTMRRPDYPGVLSQRRTVTAERVAAKVYDLLYHSRMNNTVIRL